MSREWRPIAGYEGFYEVSNDGRVRSLTRTVRAGRGMPLRKLVGQELKLTPQHSDHLRATLSRNGKQRLVFVHVLVLTAFVGPRPEGMECCHGDGDPQNNHLSNLRWDTPSANQQDTLHHGRHWQVNKTHCPSGHPYDAANTCYLSRGGRRCRACHRESQRLRQRAKRAAA